MLASQIPRWKMPDARRTNLTLSQQFLPAEGPAQDLRMPCADGQTEVVEEGAPRGRRSLLFPEASGLRTMSRSVSPELRGCTAGFLPAASLAGASESRTPPGSQGDLGQVSHIENSFWWICGMT